MDSDKLNVFTVSVTFRRESFNCMIWERVPKSRFVGYRKLKFEVFGCISINNCRVNQAEYKNTDIVKVS